MFRRCRHRRCRRAPARAGRRAAASRRCAPPPRPPVPLDAARRPPRPDPPPRPPAPAAPPAPALAPGAVPALPAAGPPVARAAAAACPRSRHRCPRSRRRCPRSLRHRRSRRRCRRSPRRHPPPRRCRRGRPIRSLRPLPPSRRSKRRRTRKAAPQELSREARTSHFGNLCATPQRMPSQRQSTTAARTGQRALPDGNPRNAQWHGLTPSRLRQWLTHADIVRWRRRHGACSRKPAVMNLEQEKMHAPEINLLPATGFAIGTMLNDTYRIVRPLAEGGCGEVYLAAHTRLPGSVRGEGAAPQPRPRPRRARRGFGRKRRSPPRCGIRTSCRCSTSTSPTTACPIW